MTLDKDDAYWRGLNSRCGYGLGEPVSLLPPPPTWE